MPSMRGTFRGRGKRGGFNRTAARAAGSPDDVDTQNDNAAPTASGGSTIAPSHVLHYLANELRVATSVYHACCHAHVSPREVLRHLPRSPSPDEAYTSPPQPLKRLRATSVAEAAALLHMALCSSNVRLASFALIDLCKSAATADRVAASGVITSTVASTLARNACTASSHTTALLALSSASASRCNVDAAAILRGALPAGAAVSPARLALLCDVAHTLPLEAFDALCDRAAGRVHSDIALKFTLGLCARNAVRDAVAFLSRPANVHLCTLEVVTALVAAAVRAGRADALKRLLVAHHDAALRSRVVHACVGQGGWKTGAKLVRSVPGMALGDFPTLLAHSQRATVGALLRMPARDLLIAGAVHETGMHAHVLEYLQSRSTEGASGSEAVAAAIAAFDAAVAAQRDGRFTAGHLLALDVAAAALYTPREGDVPIPQQPAISDDGSHSWPRGDVYVDAAGCMRLPPNVVVATVASLAALRDALTCIAAGETDAGPHVRVLGLDCEWVSSSVADSTRVAICTVAWRDHVWLLDMPALHASGEHEAMNSMFHDLFRGASGTRVIVCVYGGTGDFTALRSQHPYVTAFAGDATHVVHPTDAAALFSGAPLDSDGDKTHMCDLMALAKTRVLPPLAVSDPVVPATTTTTAESSEAAAADDDDDADTSSGEEDAPDNEPAPATAAPPQTSSGGLAALTHAALGLKLNKYWQMSNWERRPLLPGQCEYAALDAWVLPKIAAILLASPVRPGSSKPSGTARGRRRAASVRSAAAGEPSGHVA